MLLAFRFALVPILFATAFAQDSSTKVTGNKNQTSGTNNGVMIQNNITVAGPVEKKLKASAKKYLGNENGWLRVLTPAHDPSPETSCQIAPNSLAVFLGGGNASGCHSDVCTILRDTNPNADTKDLLSVERKGRSLAISAVVFDEDGKVVAALSKNRPHVNRNNVFDWMRPDEHTLDVVDQRNRRVLHVRFLNETTVYVEGLFFNSRGMKLKIDKNNLVISGPHQTGGISSTGGCAFNDRGGAFAF